MKYGRGETRGTPANGADPTIFGRHNVTKGKSGKPHCPNHRCDLIGCQDGIGQCPQSGCYFTYHHLKLDEQIKPKTKLVMKNGAYVEVPDATKETNI